MGRAAGPYVGGELPHAFRAFHDQQDLELHLFASLEAQVAAISDDIAYDCHDVEDGLRAGLLSLAELEAEPLCGPLLRSIYKTFPGLESARVTHELIRRMITSFVTDVLAESSRAISDVALRNTDEVRQAGAALIRFSPEQARREASLKRFLYANLYRHETVLRPVRVAEALIADLFEALRADPTSMPAEWAHDLDREDAPKLARRVADYIAGMTDRYAVSEHQRLFDETPDLG
jgi:dGTPase